jgi:peptide/nickel transport system ATP-binding protein
MTDEPILQVRGLKKHYPIRKGLLNRQVGAAKAVDGISFDIHRGETVGLVGESGCGKSTAATSIVRLEDPTDGEVIFNGGGRGGRTRDADGHHPNDVTRFDKKQLKAFRRDVQMVFQDPSSSFDPRMTVGGSVAEMLLVHGMTDKHRRRAIVEDLLERVGLSANDYDRYPHEFSGGQKQRIALARALVLNPELVVADEPVSALDVSIKAEILRLIEDLQEEFGLSLLFISHDMSVIRAVCDRVAVMYLGEIVELGRTEEVFSNPQHPYTEALLSSIPEPDPRAERKHIELTGTVPDPVNPPAGCRFHTRCHKVIQPEGVDIEQDVWRALITLRYQTAGRELDLEQIRESVDSDEEIGSRIRDDFDIPEQLSDPELERDLERALDAVVSEDVASAVEIMNSSFATPCEETHPEYTEHDDGHISACILHDDPVEAEVPADD